MFIYCSIKINSNTFNEAESNYYYPICFINFLHAVFLLYQLCLDEKNIYLPPRIPRGSFRKLSIFSMGPYGNLFKKRYKLSHFPHIFGISALGISFSLKYMKRIVKSHQLMNFKKKI